MKAIEKVILLLVIASLITIWGCEKDDRSSEMFLLKIDESTFKLEATKYYNFGIPPARRSIPLYLDYVETEYLAYITLTHKMTNQLVFNGTIWSGNGAIENPKPDEWRTDVEIYPQISTPVEAPSLENVRLFLSERITNSVFDEVIEKAEDDFENIWNAVNNLEFVQAFMNENAKVGLLLYIPNKDVLNLKNAKWILILYKKTDYIPPDREWGWNV